MDAPVRSALLAATVLTLGLSVIGAPAAGDDSRSAHGPASCAYIEAGPPGVGGNELVVFVPNDGDVEIRQAGPAVEVVDHPVSNQDVVVGCTGGSATTLNIDTVRIKFTGDGSVPTTIALDFPNGPLAPGATPETDGQSEIETRIEGYGATIDLNGGSGADHWEVQGDNGMVGAVLSGDPDRSDFDVTGDAAELNLFGGAGDDHIAIPGGEGFEVSSVHGGPGNDVLSGRATSLYGDAGNDQLGNGSFSAELNGGPGNDLVNGGSSRDFISGGSGRDRLLGKGGSDIIKSAGGGKDSVDCGANHHDRAVVDRRDKVRHCEERDHPTKG